jgi:uncharacterized protein involved in exopolysaccharide biosynthesis
MNPDSLGDRPIDPGGHESGLSIVELANTILRHWRMVVVIPVLLAMGVGIWSLQQKRTYLASGSFLPQSPDGRGGGGAAAIAQQFGVSIGNERPGQSPQFYVDLLRSRSVLREAVESEYTVLAEDGTVHRMTLIDFFEITEDGHPLPPWRRAVNELGRDISTSVSRTTGVVDIAVIAAQPLLAEQIAGRLLEILNSVHNEVRQNPAHEETRFITGRLEGAHAELTAAENALQRFLRLNRNYQNSPDLVFEHERLRRQVVIRQEVYTSLLRLQEQARLDAVRDTPLFTVIDHPSGTGEPRGRGTLKLILFGFLLGLFLAVSLAFIREAASSGHDAGDPEYREFRSLVRQAWKDVRHPGRWLRSGKRQVAHRGD